MTESGRPVRELPGEALRQRLFDAIDHEFGGATSMLRRSTAQRLKDAVDAALAATEAKPAKDQDDPWGPPSDWHPPEPTGAPARDEPGIDPEKLARAMDETVSPQNLGAFYEWARQIETAYRRSTSTEDAG